MIEQVSSDHNPDFLSMGLFDTRWLVHQPVTVAVWQVVSRLHRLGLLLTTLPF